MRKEDVVVGKVYMHSKHGLMTAGGPIGKDGHQVINSYYHNPDVCLSIANVHFLSEFPQGDEVCKLRQEMNNLTARVMDLEGAVTRLGQKPCVASVDSLSIIVEEPVQEGKAFPFGYEFPLYSHPGSCLGKTFGVDVEWEDEPPMTMDDFLGWLRHGQ